MGNPFTSIPPKVRQYLYLGYALVGLVLGGLQVYGLNHIGELNVSKCLEVLAYIGVPLGFTAASNLPSYEDVVEGDAAPERGAIDLGTAVVVCLLVVLVLVLVGALR